MHYLDNNFYHIFNRGSRKQLIFFSERNYDYLSKLLYSNSKKYNVEVIAYCFMPNHYHLLLKQLENGSISKTLQTSFNSYVQAINKSVGINGSLFQGKPKSVTIDSEEYFKQLLRYIHRNPFDAGLVAATDEWKYSDYSRWIDGNTYQENRLVLPAWIPLRKLYFKTGSLYKDFVENYSPDKNMDISGITFD
jgi:putative transposase